MSQKPFKILSLDGGGIRGIIPATFLVELERELGQPISRAFDLVAGTSTGGILALGLNVPYSEDQPKLPKYSASELLELYSKKGEIIFDADSWTMLGFADEKYDEAGIERVLEEYFGETRMSDAIAEVLVTSYDMHSRSPFFFKRNKAQSDPARNFPMKKAARATSAAPTYFEPLFLERDHNLVDGGVFVNNPTMTAVAHALSMGVKMEDIFLVSVGTGQGKEERIEYSKAKDWGLASWIRPLIDVMMDGASDATDYQLRQMFAPSPERYHRLQVTLEKGTEAMDNTDPENLLKLKAAGERMLTEHKNDVTQIVQFLKANA